MRQIFFFISLIVLGFGLYLNLFYDVPDVQITINFFVSWFLIIISISSILINLFWSKARKNKAE